MPISGTSPSSFSSGFDADVYLQNQDAHTAGTQALAKITPLFNVNLYAFGAALGTGLKLSDKYTTLSAAQGVYPHATALTNTIDWCAAQGAVNAAAAAGGGTVYLPARTYAWDQPLVIPPAFESSGGTTGAQVNILGDGKVSTIITATTDFGAGSYLMCCGPATATVANGQGRFANNATFIGYCQGFALLSPYTQIVKGQPPMPQGSTTTIKMSGFGWGARRELRNIYIANFYAGLEIVGDHTRFDDVICEENFYGLYFANPNTSLYGDLIFTKCAFSGAFAGIGVHPNASVNGQFNSCYFGSQPVAFVKEAGAGNNALLTSCKFSRCQFENLGNGLFRDLNAYGGAGTSSTTTGGVTTATGTKTARMVEAEFDGFCYYSLNTGNRITTLYWPSSGASVAFGYESVIDVGYLELCFFRFSTMANWLPGSTSILDAVGVSSSGNPGAVFEGNVDGMLANCSVATPFATRIGYPTAKQIKLVSPGVWDGNCWDTQGAGLFPQGAVAGDVAEQSYGEATIGGATAY